MSMTVSHCSYYFFFFNDTATTEIYTLSLHDALPIFVRVGTRADVARLEDRIAQVDDLLTSVRLDGRRPDSLVALDRKSTRLNSSHLVISYAVFCLEKKN